MRSNIEIFNQYEVLGDVDWSLRPYLAVKFDLGIVIGPR
jgi:hypothetical protein